MDRLTTATISQAAAAVVALILAYAWFISPLKHIPGPFLARFTNLWRLFSVLGRSAEQKQRQLHDHYGTAVRLGPNMVSISDPAMIDQVYGRKNMLRKSDMYMVNDLNVDGRRVENVFSTRDEQMNTRVMKPIIKLFSMGNLLKMEGLIDKTIDYFVQRLTEEFAHSGKACNMDRWLHYCAWDVIADTTFSKRLGFLEQGRDVENMIKIGFDAMDYFSVIGMMPWLDLFLDKNTVKRVGPPFFAPGIKFALERIAARRAATDGHDSSATPDFLDGFLAARDANPEIVTEDTLLSYTMINVAAGADTVATELRSILYHLCKTPEKMKRLQQELDQAKAVVPVLWRQCQQLPYLCACVEEGARLMPGISLPLERIVAEGGMVLSDGRTIIPAGTAVGINPWVINRDLATFGDDPHGFHPERWLAAKGESDAAYKTRVARMRAGDFTFGAGKRQCAGRSLALLEIHKVIGSLVRAFDIELVDTQQSWTTTNSWFIRQSNMDMRLRRREL